MDIKKIFGAHLRGLLFAITLTVGLIFVLALLMQHLGLTGGVVFGVTQFIKCFSIFVGVLHTLKTVAKNAWVHGGILGLAYTVLVFLILSIIDGNFSITNGLLVEICFAVVVGILCAFLLRMKKRTY
jgi:putative membrane protein (TIGR04086 family)